MPLSYRGVIKRLKKKGFVFFRQGKGSHEFWKNEETGQVLLLAKHTKDFPSGTLTKIVKEIGFKSLKDFQDFS